MNEKKSMPILVSEDKLINTNDTKSIFKALDKKITSLCEINIDVQTLSENLNAYLKDIGGVLSSIPVEMGEYSLQEVTLNLALGAKGEVRLIAGVESNINGGISLKLVKKVLDSSQGI